MDKVALTKGELLRFFSGDDREEIAGYMASLLTLHRCYSLFKEIQAYNKEEE